MTGVLHIPPRTHHCNPGWEAVPPPAGPTGEGYLKPVNQFVPAGTVWECPCGQAYVAYYARGTGHMAALWRPERWWARRRRLRTPQTARGDQ